MESTLQNIKSEFSELGFEKYLYTKGRRSLADSFTKNNRSGIYILHFENGEYYVGLAIDVVNRHAQHRKTYSDIEYVSFKEVAKSKLAEVEKETVYILENLKKPLRNINIVSIILGDTDLDLIIPKVDQERWLNYETPYNIVDLERFNYPELRRKYTKKFDKFGKHQLFESCTDILQSYINLTVPFPKQTEYSFWCCTCLPSSGLILTRVNIFWQETFNIREDEVIFRKYGFKKRRRGLVITIFLSKNILFENFTKKELESRYESIFLGDHIYPTGGQDQQQVFICDYEFFDFINNKLILDAIKAFNLRLMRKGGCIFNRYHCFDLADEALRTDNFQQ